MIRVYLDSNVFIAFILQESGGLLKMQYQEAENFFADCHKKYVLIISDHTLKEINKKVHYSREDVFNFLFEENISFEFVEATTADFELARRFVVKGVHFEDALHAAIAINSKCFVIVTFNIRDFKAISEICAKEPSGLL